MAHTLNILIVDDDQGDRKQCMRTLKQAGLLCECVEVETIEEALMACDRCAFDCAIVDYRIPGHDGLQGITALHERLPYMSIIMATGQGNELVATEAMKRGASDYITKARIDGDTIKRVVESAVEKTTLRRKLAQQQEELEKFASVLDIALNNMARGLSMFDVDQRLVVCNKLYGEIYSLPEHLTRPGSALADILRYYVKRGTGRDGPEEIDGQREWITQHITELARGKNFTRSQHLKGGRIVLVSNQPLPDGGWVEIQEDVTERRQAEQKIMWLARHDPLTEISNRLHFGEELEHALEQLRPESGFALHWIDLDHFKEINDTLGHPVGDALLKSVAKRLLNTVRKPDLVARLGGDEFAVIQAGGKTRSGAEKLSKRLLDALSRPHHVLGHQIESRASIGVALAPDHGADAEALLKNADVALYAAKSAGRGTVAFFQLDCQRVGQACVS